MLLEVRRKLPGYKLDDDGSGAESKDIAERVTETYGWATRDGIVGVYLILAHSFIAEFLRSRQYKFTLSVFLPESHNVGHTVLRDVFIALYLMWDWYRC